MRFDRVPILDDRIELPAHVAAGFLDGQQDALEAGLDLGWGQGVAHGRLIVTEEPVESGLCLALSVRIRLIEYDSPNLFVR